MRRWASRACWGRGGGAPGGGGGGGEGGWGGPRGGGGGGGRARGSGGGSGQSGSGGHGGSGRGAECLAPARRRGDGGGNAAAMRKHPWPGEPHGRDSRRGGGGVSKAVAGKAGRFAAWRGH